MFLEAARHATAKETKDTALPLTLHQWKCLEVMVSFVVPDTFATLQLKLIRNRPWLC